MSSMGYNDGDEEKSSYDMINDNRRCEDDFFFLGDDDPNEDDDFNEDDEIDIEEIDIEEIDVEKLEKERFSKRKKEIIPSSARSLYIPIDTSNYIPDVLEVYQGFSLR